jgi:hypothetical protein
MHDGRHLRIGTKSTDVAMVSSRQTRGGLEDSPRYPPASTTSIMVSMAFSKVSSLSLSSNVRSMPCVIFATVDPEILEVIVIELGMSLAGKT